MTSRRNPGQISTGVSFCSEWLATGPHSETVADVGDDGGDRIEGEGEAEHHAEDGEADGDDDSGQSEEAEDSPAVDDGGSEGDDEARSSDDAEQVDGDALHGGTPYLLGVLPFKWISDSFVKSNLKVLGCFSLLGVVYGGKDDAAHLAHVTAQCSAIRNNYDRIDAAVEQIRTNAVRARQVRLRGLRKFNHFFKDGYPSG